MRGDTVEGGGNTTQTEEGKAMAAIVFASGKTVRGQGADHVQVSVCACVGVSPSLSLSLQSRAKGKARSLSLFS